MTNRERLKKVFNFDFENLDRLPYMEWAPWWDETLSRWQNEGIDPTLKPLDVAKQLGLDVVHHFWISPRDNNIPPIPTHGCGRINSKEDYLLLKKRYLYTDDKIKSACEQIKKIKPLHDSGEIAVCLTLEGFFWYPRTLFGIENHLYAFYDHPDLMHEINQDCVNYEKKIIDAIYNLITPDFMTFAEDMSYNSGPMLSKQMFDTFLAPYYNQLIPELKKKGTFVFIDSDGDITQLIPWLQEIGAEGLLPLERQSGVDIQKIRQQYPHFLMVGAYNKLIIKNGEKAMRDEFERILPVMKSGGYIPCCDHQTPPEVSLENYKLYRKLSEEYCLKAIQNKI